MNIKPKKQERKPTWSSDEQNKYERFKSIHLDHHVARRWPNDYRDKLEEVAMFEELEAIKDQRESARLSKSKKNQKRKDLCKIAWEKIASPSVNFIKNYEALCKELEANPEYNALFVAPSERTLQGWLSDWKKSS